MKLDIRPHMHRSYVSSKTILSEYQKGKLIQLFKRHVLDMRGILGRLAYTATIGYRYSR